MKLTIEINVPQDAPAAIQMLQGYLGTTTHTPEPVRVRQSRATNGNGNGAVYHEEHEVESVEVPQVSEPRTETSKVPGETRLLYDDKQILSACSIDPDIKLIWKKRGRKSEADINEINERCYKALQMDKVDEAVQQENEEDEPVGAALAGHTAESLNELLGQSHSEDADVEEEGGQEEASEDDDDLPPGLRGLMGGNGKAAQTESLEDLRNWISNHAEKTIGGNAGVTWYRRVVNGFGANKKFNDLTVEYMQQVKANPAAY